MNIKIYQSKMRGTIALPASKSYAHRMLIAASLSHTPSIIKGTFNSVDIDVTINALNRLGAQITVTDYGANVVPLWQNTTQTALINAKESGSTLRFLLPIAAALGVSATFLGEGRLADRPIGNLLDALAKRDITISNNTLPLTISGKLTSGNFDIDASISSQFVTGLLLALPLINAGGSININDTIVSQSYINVTLEVLAMYGIAPQRYNNTFYLMHGDYQAAAISTVPSDWSSASFFAVAGALLGGVTLKNMKYPSCQGDSAIIKLLKNMGAKITLRANGDISVYQSELMAIMCDASDFPDLVPILSIAMAASRGLSKITGVNRLAHKESDRLSAIIAMLTAFNVDCWAAEDSLYIQGGTLVGGVIDGASDHRIVMSAIIGGSYASGETTVLGAEAINKSYKNFIYDYKKLGGRCDAISQ